MIPTALSKKILTFSQKPKKNVINLLQKWKRNTSNMLADNFNLRITSNNIDGYDARFSSNDIGVLENFRINRNSFRNTVLTKTCVELEVNFSGICL